MYEGFAFMVKKKFKENKPDSNNNNVKEEPLEQIKNLKEQLLRVNADFQNFKKRIEKDKSEWFELAQATVIKEFLPIIDDFERAIQSIEKIEKKDIKKEWFEGLELVSKKLKKVFDDLGVKQIECSGQFNPEIHEALMHVESKDHKSGLIVQVLNKGYTFKERVLRCAKVSVAK